MYDEKYVYYLTFQREKCPTSGKEHWQGYVELKDKFSLKKVKEILGDESAHLEIRKGTQKQATDYCHKTDTSINDEYFEHGVPKSQGCRNDLDNIVDAIEDSMTAREILLQFRGNALRHMGMIQRGLEAYHGLNTVGAIDKTILLFRNKCPEVIGNTNDHFSGQENY